MGLLAVGVGGVTLALVLIHVTELVNLVAWSRWAIRSLFGRCAPGCADMSDADRCGCATAPGAVRVSSCMCPWMGASRGGHI